ncbi:hypothetical protein AU381_21540 [Sinorhizobium glycinis]|uniref:Uncharacterized protein n=1 Tax=Sinorhizobium glycinis TaxID=1472378 RepID=A0A178XSK9_9HYPH|nr:hypothetical protein AU381_21540 [Sinorhizobium glycinis]
MVWKRPFQSLEDGKAIAPSSRIFTGISLRDAGRNDLAEPRVDVTLARRQVPAEALFNRDDDRAG